MHRSCRGLWLWGILFASTADAGLIEFVGREYQAQAGSNAGTIRGGNPANDAQFQQFLSQAQLATAQLTPSHLYTTGQGPRAVWGRFATDAGLQSSYSYTVHSVTVTARIISYDPALPGLLGGPDGTARLDVFGADGTTLQSGSPRPGFASGAGAGYYIGTSGGLTTNLLRNGVQFDLSQFAGGGVTAFGLFAGDLESGGRDGSDADTLGSPRGFLRLAFDDGSFHDVMYEPDETLSPDIVYSGNNNISETMGNETGRFIGAHSTDRRIVSASLIVGDDDLDDNGSSEQFSLVAPLVFLNGDGAPLPLPLAAVPEPSSLALAGFLAGATCLARGLRRIRRR